MRHILTFVCLFLLSYGVRAQTLDQAKQMYLEGRFDEALPAFEKAIKGAPRNASYNQWYGTCLFETGQAEAAESYLVFAASKKITEAYHSLGRLYYEQYRFRESVTAYEEYIALLEKAKKTPEAEAVQPALERSRRAARMLSRCEDIQIIDSVIVDQDNFLSVYRISREAGTLSPLFESAAFENALSDKRYYGKLNNDSIYRIFSETKLVDGWGDQRELNLHADSLAQDNYPFVLSDGVTIYFASTGHGSLGGYDIFATRYNLNNDTYLAPNQMGMPFNSLANDYMLVIDELNELGYFATDRYQTDGQVVVYTFIPNESFAAIEEEEEVLRDRARLTSIRDTWQKDEAYYADYLSDAYRNMEQELQLSKRDFVFVINDEVVYYNLNDFSTDAAKQLYLKIEEMEETIATLEADLEEQRLVYARAGKEERRRMATTIRERESRIEKLIPQCEQNRKELRNMENRRLRAANN